jgi:hypothetical protein
MKIADALIAHQIGIPSAVAAITFPIAAIANHHAGIGTLWALGGFLAMACLAGNLEADRLRTESRAEWEAERAAWQSKWVQLNQCGRNQLANIRREEATHAR